jgi:hypothetical protein
LHGLIERRACVLRRRFFDSRRAMLIPALGKADAQRSSMIDPRRATTVECPGRGLRGGRASLSAFQQPDERVFPGKVSESMPNVTLRRSEVPDPVPELVEGRFRLLKECKGGKDRTDEHAFDRRIDEAYRRARKLDARIVRTVASSTPGLMAQLRLLAAFYEESTNGAGRRGSLLIKTIAAGIERLDGGTGRMSASTPEDRDLRRRPRMERQPR